MKVVKLFWIDDMENWAKSAQDNLQIVAKKYNVDLHIISAVNGENVVQQLSIFDFDMVVMDYNMTPYNGDKYIRDIRDVEHLEYIPIIFYSQDTSTDLEGLMEGIKGRNKIHIVYRPYLEDAIKEICF